MKQLIEYNPKLVATIAAVKQLYKTDLEDVKAPSRARTKVLIRQQIAVINQNIGRTETAEILGLFCTRNKKKVPDHSSVCHYLTRHPDDYKYNPQYREDFDKLNNLVSQLLAGGGTKKVILECYPSGYAFAEISVHGARECMKLIPSDTRVVSVEIVNPFLCAFTKEWATKWKHISDIPDDEIIEIDSSYCHITKQGLYFSGYKEEMYMHTKPVDWKIFFSK